MPWLPAPISQSTWGATCLKSISPSFRNGVVIGGITPVGRAFMAGPRVSIRYPRVASRLSRHFSTGSKPSLLEGRALSQLVKGIAPQGSIAPSAHVEPSASASDLLTGGGINAQEAP